MENKNNLSKQVTVIGLGQMGSTLAKILLENNYVVTVWNRNASKADPLIKQGAQLANNIETAIRVSDFIVICVFDYKATNEILDRPEVKSILKGKTLIQFSTGSPADATQSEAWADQHGAFYLDGAIQVAPDHMAKPDTTIFISGLEQTFKQSKPMLDVLGGNIKYLGNRVSAASAMDLASLSYLYGSLLGFFHAVRIAEVEGFKVDELGKIIRQVSPGFAEFMEYEAGLIQSGNYAITQSPLSINVEATDRILKASEAYNINSEVPRLAASFLKRASEQGLDKEELASLIKVFRKN